MKIRSLAVSSASVIAFAGLMSATAIGPATAATVPNQAIPSNCVATTVSVTNGTSEPLEMQYDSDGTGEGYHMTYINADGSRVWGEPVLQPGQTKDFYIEVRADGEDATGLDDTASADMYPTGLNTGKAYSKIHFTAHNDGSPHIFSWISGSFGKGKAHSSADSKAHVSGRDIQADVGGWSNALALSKPVVVSIG